MPSSDDLIPAFDDIPPPPPAQETEPDDWPPTLPTKKSKKKKKAKNAATAQRLAPEDEEDTPYAKSITPSPPNHGVNLPPSQPASLPASTPPQPPQPPPSEPVDHFEVPLDHESTAVEEVDLVEQPPPPTVRPIEKSPRPLPARLVSPAISPRPQPAKLASPAASPPVRPAALHNPVPTPSHRRPSSGNFPIIQARRESVTAQKPPPRPHPMEAPPPHMNQAHFFGLPDLGLGLNQKQEPGKIAGSDGCCCCFDSLANAGDTASATRAKDALLVGSEGGLDVYRVLPDKLEVIGRLEGLRGAVIKARILPNTSNYDSFARLRPLVAVVVHGVMQDDRNDSGRDDESSHDPPGRYQTTVEIYSLQSQERIAVLYRSLPVDAARPALGQLRVPPNPVGDLTIDASGNFITVASGKSGEVYVFSHAVTFGRDPVFRCIGKFWTSLQIRPDPPRPPGQQAGDATEPEKRPRVPLLSLSHRWLAVVPPYTSAGISIQGWPLLSAEGQNPPGLNTHVAPAQPHITCEIGGVDAEGTLGWLSRKAAQGLVKASQRGYEIGMQGWKELTQPSPPNSGPVRPASRDREMFPPTNAPSEDPQRLAKEPALVSLIDLNRLLEIEATGHKQVPNPLATFALVEGCNHLSFAPEGLHLLTTSRKGEVSTVWDLKHAAHSSLSLEDSEDSPRGPHVRQVHRMARTTTSVVLESVWSTNGTWLALLTAHGTIHLHHIPDASTRRRRRRHTASSSAEKADATVSVSEGMSPPSSSGLWNSVRSGWQSVSTQVNAIRTQGPGIPTFAGFREATAAASNAGTRAVARGLSQGYTAAKGGASDIWHAEDNKIRHKPLQEAATNSACLLWIQKRSETLLGVVHSGNVYLHPVQQIVRRKGDDDVTGLKKYPQRTFALPRISVNQDAGTQPSDCAQQGPHGFWILRNTNTDNRLNRQANPGASLTTDVETNPPYCPFHIDSRISIYAFEDHPSQVYSGTATHWHLQGHDKDDNEPWVFGGPLPPSVKVNESSMGEQDVIMQQTSEMVDEFSDQVESKLVHDQGQDRISVNTRRTGFGDEYFNDVLVDDMDDMA